MIRKLFCLMLAVGLVLGLCACGKPQEPENPNANYQVTVVDATGQPVTSGVIVKFMQGDAQAAMQVVDANGRAVKELPKADYTVELKFTDANANFFYDTSDLKLTAARTELTVSLVHSVTGEPVELSIAGEGATAYAVDAVATRVPLTVGQRSYFLFAPQQAGTYEVSVREAGTALGCYGTPFYMMEDSMFPVVDNTFVMSMRADMVGEGSSNVMVIGIDSDSATSCVLSILRTGDAAWDVEDEPWDIYKTTAQLSPYTLPEGAMVQPFDLTASTGTYELVFNEADGFFHLNSENGPLVLVFLGKDCKYISCYKTIMSKTGVKKYFFDEDGSFLKKEAYDDCLREYFEYMDPEEGVYPLTKDLQYIIQNHGGYNGWWDLDKNTCLLVDEAGNPLPGANEEIGWLLMCGYITQ